MDAEKVELLFDGLPDWADADDPDDRAALLAEELGQGGPEYKTGDEADDRSDDGPASLRLALRQVIANQIADEDPPEVWATAQRLMAGGHDRTTVLAQLDLALAQVMKTTMQEHRPFEASEYAAALDRLPLPSVAEMADALIEIARERQPIEADDLDRLAAERLGLDLDDEVEEELLDGVCDRLVDEGVLEYLAADLMVHVASLTEGIVLTHRLNDAEISVGVMSAVFDLAGFDHFADLRLTDGRVVEPFSVQGGHLAWHGPEGWLSGLVAGDVVAVGIDPEGVVSLERLHDPPPLDEDLVSLVRSVYDDEVAEADLPVSGRQLVLGMLARDRNVLARPRAPLENLCAAAGLERRGDLVAHEPSLWHNQKRLRQMWRLYDQLDDEDQRRAAARVLEVCDDPDADRAALLEAADDLYDPTLASVVTDEMLGLHDDPELLQLTEAFAERLVEVATKAKARAVARWLMAVVAERRGEALIAEQQLHLAVESDPTWGPAVDRLAWYTSDRGDAVEAARLWRRLGIGVEDNRDLAEVLPFTEPAGPRLGRNDACWCGSGRKFKQCHLGRRAPATLPDRVGWLYRKAVAYIERRGGLPGYDVLELARSRAVDPGDPASLAEALADPLVTDVALHEGGWFERFVAERGPLLPDDEALLASAWLLVERSVYEILETHPGEGMSVRDLRTGDRLDVRERSFSTQARVSGLVCARVVPDGVTNQFIGGLFAVAPGSESALLDLLDNAEAEDLLEYVAKLHRPPELRTREGEPMVVCTATVDVADPQTARGFLDANYEADDGAWVEMHELGHDESILRATLRLEGNTLSVETTSEPRMERVLARLSDGLTGARVVTDRRRPFVPGRDPLPVPDHLGTPDDAGSAAGTTPSPDPAVIGQVQDRMEQRWLDEAVPALGGLTPRQAAKDPTRREELARLIAGYPVPEPDSGLFTLRPDRLRRELGLEGG